MTKAEKMECKRFAKEGMKDAGLKVNLKDMILLEMSFSSTGSLRYVGNTEMYIDYVMFEDAKTGNQYQVFYGKIYYNPKTKSLYKVNQYA